MKEQNYSKYHFLPRLVFVLAGACHITAVYTKEKHQMCFVLNTLK